MKKKKLKFKVPVSWAMAATVEVEAKDLAEAVEVAKADFAQYGGEFLPEGKFVKNSYYVEFEAIDVHQEEKTLDEMYKQMDDMAAGVQHYPKGYGVGGHIDSKGKVLDDAYCIDASHVDSEGTVWDKDGSLVSTPWDEVAEVERHRGLVIGEDGTVEKLV